MTVMLYNDSMDNLANSDDNGIVALIRNQKDYDFYCTNCGANLTVDELMRNVSCECPEDSYPLAYWMAKTGQIDESTWVPKNWGFFALNKKHVVMKIDDHSSYWPVYNG